MILALLVGCIPLPYALPPADFAVAVDPIPAAEVPGSPPGVTLSAGIAPLSVVPKLARRTIDPSAGVYGAFNEDGTGVPEVGLYGRVAWRAWRHDFSNSFVTVEPRGTVDVRLDQPGGAILAGAAFRLGGWSHGEVGASASLSGGGVGVAWGESGIAIAVEGGGAYGVDVGLSPRVLFALEFRSPAAAGVFLVPVFGH